MHLEQINELPINVNTAWVFPGQGAQHVGMGNDLYKESSVAKEIFDHANDILDINISKICFEGPESDLTQTINTQPAIVVHAIAALATSIDRSITSNRPALVAGHSLGEYAALIASGSISFADGISLVRERGRLMQIACDAESSTMSAVLGLDQEKIEEICNANGSSICNINAIGNITIGGTVEAVKKSAEIPLEQGAAKVIELSVAGAFHTPLMQSAANGLKEALSKVFFQNSSIPLVSNVTGLAISDSKKFDQELVDQVTNPVLWVNSVQTMQNNGVDTLIEFGPGKILSGLARRIDRAITTRNIGTISDMA